MRPGFCSRVIVTILLTVLAVLLGGFSKSMAVMGATSRSEIKKRLELAPFAYVAETEHDYSNIQQNIYELHGKLAFIDSVTDLLTDSIEPDLSTIIAQGFEVFRFGAGSSLQEVAVPRTGRLFWSAPAPGCKSLTQKQIRL